MFERGNGRAPPLWYYAGKLGLASSDVSEGQCILRFDGEGDAAGVDACAADRANCMLVAFNRCSDTSVKVRTPLACCLLECSVCMSTAVVI